MPMRTVEYKCVFVSGSGAIDESIENIQRELDDNANEGWELIPPLVDDPRGWLLIFKRPVSRSPSDRLPVEDEQAEGLLQISHVLPRKDN